MKTQGKKSAKKEFDWKAAVRLLNLCASGRSWLRRAPRDPVAAWLACKDAAMMLWVICLFASMDSKITSLRDKLTAFAQTLPRAADECIAENNCSICVPARLKPEHIHRIIPARSLLAALKRLVKEQEKKAAT